MSNNRFCIGLLIFSSLAASAQDKPPMEITGAYQFFRSYGVNVPAGWDTSVNVPTNNWFGIVGDFGGATQSESGVTSTLYTFGGGPQFTLRTHYAQPYFRLLIGAAHSDASGYGFSGNSTAFLVAPGGGADFRISDVISFRVGFNYPLVIEHGVAATHSVGAIVGITYKFGGRQNNDDTSSAQTGTTVSSLGVVLDNKMRIIRFLPHSVLSNHLNSGDVINSINEKEVTIPADLTSATSGLAQGTVVKVGYLVHGEWQTSTDIQF
jgi:hypothetical protein